MNAAVMTLARYYARKEVEASILRNLGCPASQETVSAELTGLANAHLDSHPEIIERAAKTVRRDPALCRMAERHERKRLRRASARTHLRYP
jgi:hypothetical protein